MSDTKKDPKELEKERIAKDLATLDKMDVNDLVEVTIEKVKFRGTILKRTTRKHIKNKKKEGRIKLKVDPWVKGETIVHSLSQVKAWVTHGLVSGPKKVRKEG